MIMFTNIKSDDCYSWSTSQQREGAVVRVLRGEQMRHLDGFYDEVSAALQLPLYFGRNWDAFEECVRDLEWLPEDQQPTFIVVNAKEALSDAQERSIFVDIARAASAGFVLQFAEESSIAEWPLGRSDTRWAAQ